MLCSRWGFRCRCACLIAPVYILDLFHCKGSALALVHGCTSIWMMLVFCYRFVMMEKGKQGKTRQGKPMERKARQGKERQGKEKGHRELFLHELFSISMVRLSFHDTILVHKSSMWKYSDVRSNLHAVCAIGLIVMCISTVVKRQLP